MGQRGEPKPEGRVGVTVGGIPAPAPAVGKGVDGVSPAPRKRSRPCPPQQQLNVVRERYPASIQPGSRRT